MDRADNDTCPSDLLIDRYLAGELDGAERSGLEGHLSGCVGCRELVTQRRTELAAWQASAGLAASARDVAARARLQPDEEPRRPRWRLSLWGPGLALAATAALLLVVLLPRETHVVRTPGLRIKGGFALGAFLKRGDTVSRARSNQVFHPGDRLRFTYTARRPGHLALVGLDAKNVVTLYHPPGGGLAPRVKPGVSRVLAQATVLDTTLGQETVVGLLCPRAFSTDELRRTAPRLIAALRRGQNVARLLPAPDCRVARFELRKGP